MLNCCNVVGHGITTIFADDSRSDEPFNYCDFVYLLDNGLAFRLPFDDETDQWLPPAQMSRVHRPALRSQEAAMEV